MQRLIDADVLLQVPNVRKVTEYDETGEFITYLAVPVEAIQNAPTIEAEPVRHGRWIERRDELRGLFNGWECSKCKQFIFGEKLNSCPGCRAKMDLEEKQT